MSGSVTSPGPTPTPYHYPSLRPSRGPSSPVVSRRWVVTKGRGTGVTINFTLSFTRCPIDPGSYGSGTVSGSSASARSHPDPGRVRCDVIPRSMSGPWSRRRSSNSASSGASTSRTSQSADRHLESRTSTTLCSVYCGWSTGARAPAHPSRPAFGVRWYCRRSSSSCGISRS